MKRLSKSRILSLFLALTMIFTAIPISGVGVAGENNTAPFTNPFSQEVRFDVNGRTESSRSYRIPSMVTLAVGTIVGAADIRWISSYDGGGLDTLVARSTVGGANWSYTVANYLGDNGNVYNGSHSTAFLDPSLLVAADGKTVYMLVDLYPYGVALNGDKDSNNAYVHTQPSTAIGFNGDGYLKLSGNNHTSYDYYLKNGKIYTSHHEEVSGYTVDPYFNITGDNGINSNLFFENSPFKVVRTGYLYLTKSTNGGETWSVPQLLNVKTTSERVCLVAPGSSITTRNGTMVFPVYSYHGDNKPEGNTQRLSFIYSKDGVNWSRTEELNHNWASEAAVVELQDGTLRFFIRNGSQRLQYVDYTMGSGWGTIVTMDNVKTNSNTQISAIKYSRTVNGEQVILVSCPTGPDRNGSNDSGAGNRLNGSIFVFTVDSTGKMELANTIEVTKNNNQFMYSCLTERADGSVAILYEDQEHGWGVSGGNGESYTPNEVTTYYTMDIKVFDLEDELEDKNIAFDAADVTASGSGIPSDSRFVAKEITDTQEIEKLLIGADANDVLQFDLDENGDVIRRYFALDAPYRFLDLSFLNGNDNEVQPNGVVTVTMDAASLGLSDGDHFFVYHIHPNDDGTYTNEWLNEGKPLNANNCKVSFDMDQFSYVLILNSTYKIENRAFYLVQNYYDNKEFPVSTNGNWGLLGVYIDADNVAHVLIGQLTNNINRDKVGYISINGEQYSGENINIFDTGKLTQLIQENTSGETVETVDLSTTNLTGKSSIQAVWDVKADKLAVTEVFKLLLHATAGGFEIGETEVDLKLEYSVTKDVVSVDGNTSLSGNSVVLPTTLTSDGISSNYFGKEIIYRITARNTGDVDLYGVKVSDILPSGFYKGDVYTSQDGMSWTQASVADGKIEVATFDLGAQASKNCYVKVTMADTMATGTYTNTAELNVNNVVTNATAEVLLQNPEQGVLRVSK